MRIVPSDISISFGLFQPQRKRAAARFGSIGGAACVPSRLCLRQGLI
jgi:hypothetical protein